MLRYLTCDQIASWNDAWYCNEEYDRLYQEQNQAVDEETRIDAVHQMQQLLFEESPYLVTAYSATGEAIRTDRFACLRPQPDPGGIWLFQYGVSNYLNMRPAAEAGDCDGVTTAIGATGSTTSGGDDEGTNTWVPIAGGVVVLALLAGGGLWAFRRRSTASERE